MRTMVLSLFLGWLGLLAPAFAQSADLSIGTVAMATTALKLHTSAPKWWSWSLPEPTATTLEANQLVRVLEQTSHKTLLGQDEWFLVTSVCESSKDSDCEEHSGWVLGSDSGQPLLTPQPK